MKSVSVGCCRLILGILLCALALLAVGCSTSQLGETSAEGHRRHKRVMRLNQQELMSDIDRVFLLDEPSKLTDKRIP